MKTLLEGLTATHDFTRSFPLERYGNTPQTGAVGRSTTQNPPLSHPVIRTHPVSGRRSLFVNEGFTSKINELSETESEAILKFLFAHAPGRNSPFAGAGRKTTSRSGITA
jgi:taurine dioxygenase